MSTIGPGDFVECVDDRPTTMGPLAVHRGGVYRAEAVLPPAFECSLCGGPCAGLMISGLKSLGPRGAFKACRFRPIYRPKGTFEQLLKQPEPA